MATHSSLPSLTHLRGDVANAKANAANANNAIQALRTQVIQIDQHVTYLREIARGVVQLSSLLASLDSTVRGLEERLTALEDRT